MKSIAIILPFFGKWPEWAGLFFDSCRHNATVDFIFFTDCEVPTLDAPNLRFYPISFNSYSEMVSQKLGIDFRPDHPYKLCDLKPFYGLIHQDLLNGYDFWGYGDIDLIWGDIRYFYSDEILQRYDVMSTHADRLSGHLTLIRNTQHYTQLPLSIDNWKDLLCSPANHAVDEIPFTKKIYPAAPWLWKIHKHIFFRFKFYDEWVSYNRFCRCFNRLFKPRKLYLKEQYTTPWFTDTEAATPDIINRWRWRYCDGHIHDQRTGNELIYLHFLRLKKIWQSNFYSLNNTYDSVEIDIRGIHPAQDKTHT